MADLEARLCAGGCGQRGTHQAHPDQGPWCADCCPLCPTWEALGLARDHAPLIVNGPEWLSIERTPTSTFVYRGENDLLIMKCGFADDAIARAFVAKILEAQAAGKPIPVRAEPTTVIPTAKMFMFLAGPEEPSGWIRGPGGVMGAPLRRGAFVLDHPADPVPAGERPEVVLDAQRPTVVTASFDSTADSTGAAWPITDVTSYPPRPPFEPHADPLIPVEQIVMLRARDAINDWMSSLGLTAASDPPLAAIPVSVLRRLYAVLDLLGELDLAKQLWDGIEPEPSPVRVGEHDRLFPAQVPGLAEATVATGLDGAIDAIRDAERRALLTSGTLIAGVDAIAVDVVNDMLSEPLPPPIMDKLGLSPNDEGDTDARIAPDH